jgi:hypothetical protein
MTNSRIGAIPIILFCAIVAATLAPPARAQQTVGREQDIVGLRLGQRVMVDDGTCPAGEVKQVLGSKMTTAGVMATSKCVPRVGPKKK